jgi:hypothetical protein
VWRALTHELRLTVAQLYLTSLGTTDDDVRAARLAATESAETDFPAMLRRQCQAWRKTFLPLARGNGPVAVVTVGADMEMVTLAVRAERTGPGTRTPPYRFLVRYCGPDITIAAIGHRLPLPGWPPTLWSIPHLLR